MYMYREGGRSYRGAGVGQDAAAGAAAEQRHVGAARQHRILACQQHNSTVAIQIRRASRQRTRLSALRSLTSGHSCRAERLGDSNDTDGSVVLFA